MRRAWSRKILPGFVVFLGIALVSIVVFRVETHNTVPIPQTSFTPVQIEVEAEDPEQFLDYEAVDKLFHRGYEVRKVNANDATHVVIKRNGKTFAKFNGFSGPLGNDADFGLFDLLGNKSEQLIISVRISRGGRHWVVSLDGEVRVLFDSADYDVGREEFSIIDIDKDGVHEICLPIVSFYGMGGLEFSVRNSIAANNLQVRPKADEIPTGKSLVCRFRVAKTESRDRRGHLFQASQI